MSKTAPTSRQFVCIGARTPIFRPIACYWNLSACVAGNQKIEVIHQIQQVAMFLLLQTAVISRECSVRCQALAERPRDALSKRMRISD